MDFTASQMVEDVFNQGPKLTMSLTADSSSLFATRTLAFDKGPIYIGQTNGLFLLGNDIHPSANNGIFEELTVSRRHAVGVCDGHR